MGYQEEISSYIPKNVQETIEKDVILDYMNHCSYNLLERESKLAHITVSAMIFNETFDKILMVHHKVYQTWSWPGGHADGNPDLFFVAQKEIAEETGIADLVAFGSNILSLDILSVHGHWKHGSYVNAHLHFNICYGFVASENSPLQVNQEETNGVRWIECNKLQEYSNEKHMISIYFKIVNGLEKSGDN